MVRHTDAATGDRIEVTTDDSTYGGVVTGTETSYFTSDTVDRGMGAADVTTFERDDGHVMHVYDHGDAIDLYTARSRGKKAYQPYKGTKAIVSRDVTVDVTPTDSGFDDPDGVDLSDVAPGDTVVFKTSDGDVYSFGVVDVVVNPNGHGRRDVAFDDGDLRRSRRLTSYGVGKGVAYADGDIAEPDHDDHSVIGIRVD